MALAVLDQSDSDGDGLDECQARTLPSAATTHHSPTFFASAGMRHGVGGVYCGGRFRAMGEIEDLSSDACGGCGGCRSEQQQREISRFDVAVVGAGAVGAAVARELSRYSARVVLIEAAEDVGQGASKANSGIVHAGFHEGGEELRARYAVRGNAMFAQLDEELHFGFRRSGAVVVAQAEDQLPTLTVLLERGKANGVPQMRLLSREELLQLEPSLGPQVVGGLLAPSAGVVMPMEYCSALVENAVHNGVELRLRRRLVASDRSDDGTWRLTLQRWVPQRHRGGGEASVGTRSEADRVRLEDFAEGGSASMRFNGGTVEGEETVRARFVVNAAGGAAATVAGLFGDRSFKISQRLGDYLVLPRGNEERLLQSGLTLFPCPTSAGKGILVQRSLWGNILLGPTARDVGEGGAPASDAQIQQLLVQQALQLVPELPTAAAFGSFRGARARCDRRDWVVERSAAAPGLVNVAGIDSPGLTASPALALAVADLLREAGLVLVARPDFDPRRRAVVRPKRPDGGDGLVLSSFPDRFRCRDARRNVVCKCERVTEAEVVAAIHAGVPLSGTEAVRRRTRAGMGACQGHPDEYDCERRVAEIVARERGMPLAQVGRRAFPASSTLASRWPDWQAKL